MSLGFPARVDLERWATHLRDVFEATPYHVGSSLKEKRDWHDVDVVVLVSDEQWEQLRFGMPGRENNRWAAVCAAFSHWGRAVTGLPIDFKVQQVSYANEKFDGMRSALGILWRSDDWLPDLEVERLRAAIEAFRRAKDDEDASVIGGAYSNLLAAAASIPEGQQS